MHLSFKNYSSIGPGKLWGGLGGPCPPLPTNPTPPHFFAKEKEKREERKKRTIFKAETIERLSPRSKCYCFSHSRVSRILVGQLWWPTILFSVPWPIRLWNPFCQPWSRKAVFSIMFGRWKIGSLKKGNNTYLMNNAVIYIQLILDMVTSW